MIDEMKTVHRTIHSIAMQFKTTPTFAMSTTLSFLVEKTIVFGGVEAGKANAHEVETEKKED